MKFKAAILTELNKPLDVAEIELTELKIGQVLVQNIISGLCGSQLLEIEGKKNNARFIPHLLGHESVGTVIDVGIGVQNVKINDKVIVHWRKSKGIESEFPTYKYGEKYITSGKCTTLSEYSVVSENRLTVVDSASSNEVSALLGCCLSTSMAAVIKDAQIKLGSSVLILGCGGLGISMSYISQLMGIKNIVGIDRVDKKEIMANVGCNFSCKIPDTQFDFIFDTTGSNYLINEALPKLKDKGKFIFLTPHNLNIPTDTLFSENGKRMIFSQGGSFHPSDDLSNFLEILEQHNFDYTKIVTHRFPLENINRAVETLRSGHAGRILIDL